MCTIVLKHTVIPVCTRLSDKTPKTQVCTSMGQKSSKDVQINGTVAPGYEPVKEMFTDNFRKGREESAQLCVYVGEEKVVDIWASTTIPSYTADTLTNVFSSTKNLTAIAMAIMQERGLIEYGAKIAEYWPEFGQNGKEEVTVADLMRHEAGLANFDSSLDVHDPLTEKIKKNAIGKIIESQKLSFPETGKREYHAITRGWIANEIFRRIHPEGTTIGEFLQQEINGPLNADAFVGINDAHVDNYAPVVDMKMSFVIGQSMIPNIFGRGVDCNIFELCSFFNMMRKYAKDSGEKKPAFADHNGLEMNTSAFFNQEIVRRGETSSVNGNCSARGEHFEVQDSSIFTDTFSRSCRPCSCDGKQGIIQRKDNSKFICLGSSPC